MPKRNKANLPYIEAGRTMRNIPDLTFNEYAGRLQAYVTPLPRRAILTAMYEDYLTYQGRRK